MLEPLPIELSRRYETQLKQNGIAKPLWNHYTKWLRYYWDFCHEHGHPPNERQSFPPFDEKLRAKHQSESQRQQAKHAMSLYYGIAVPDRRGGAESREERVAQRSSKVHPGRTDSLDPSTRIATRLPAVRPMRRTQPDNGRDGKYFQSRHSPQPNLDGPHVQVIPMESSKLTGCSWVSVYDRLRVAIKIRHYSPKTWQGYKTWIRHFQTFTRSKDPEHVSMEDVKGFLNYLAIEKKVAASSQNQAFNALLFLFNRVLEKEFGRVEGVVRAKRTKYIPVVLSRAEVDQVIRFLESPYDLVVKLLYGCGLRLFECLKLPRWKRSSACIEKIWPRGMRAPSYPAP